MYHQAIPHIASDVAAVESKDSPRDCLNNQKAGASSVKRQSDETVLLEGTLFPTASTARRMAPATGSHLKGSIAYLH